MEYNISVLNSNPTSIVGVVTYYDSVYGVTLSRENGEAVFRIWGSSNGTSPNEFRIEMDSSGNVKEYALRMGSKFDIATPQLLADVPAKSVSQIEFLTHVADVLSTL